MAIAHIQRKSTPQRWRSALKRAIAEGIEVRQLQGSGMWIATSATDPNTAYEVSPWECECQAGQFDDPVCKHRAALLLKLGRRCDLAGREVHHALACTICHGTGVVPSSSSLRVGHEAGISLCTECDGSGFSTGRRAA